jgi:hypothetical protein
MTTYNISNATDLYGHLTGQATYPESYSIGDILQIAAGNYILGGNVTPPDGRLGGVIIRGAGINSTIINPRIWSIVADGRMWLEDMWIRLDGMAAPGLGYGSMNLIDGRFDLARVRISSNGANTGNCLTFVADDSACVARLDSCQIYGAEKDCLSSKAPGGEALARMSLVTTKNCIIYDQGTGSIDQCVTPHDGFAIDCHGGVIRSRSTATGDAIRPDDVDYSYVTLNAVGVPVGTIDSRVTGTWWQPAGWQSRN